MTASPPTKPRPRRRMAITTLLRRASSTAASRFTISGRIKERHRPAAISLAPIMALPPPDDDEHNPRDGVVSNDSIVGRERS
jgi:hypothetical protein